MVEGARDEVQLVLRHLGIPHTLLRAQQIKDAGLNPNQVVLVNRAGNDVVVVEDALPGHPFTEGVFGNVPAMKWWLEIQAFPIRVLDPERVDVLVDSAEMRLRYGSSPMALTFRWGLGKVQHSLSHFYLQEEGMQQARGEEARKVFCADHLGIPLETIREIAAKGGFAASLNEETMKRMAPDHSMFRMIVNVVAEKNRWVEDL